MQKLIIPCFTLSLALLVGCSTTKPLYSRLHAYQPDVQQGNLISQSMIQQLKVGMSKEQVANILGYPVFEDTFNHDHWSYLHTFQHNSGPMIKKRLDLYFQNEQLVRIEGDVNKF